VASHLLVFAGKGLKQIGLQNLSQLAHHFNQMRLELLRLFLSYFPKSPACIVANLNPFEVVLVFKVGHLESKLNLVFEDKYEFTHLLFKLGFGHEGKELNEDH
jgi:hypothetical protein